MVLSRSDRAPRLVVSSMRLAASAPRLALSTSLLGLLSLLLGCHSHPAPAPPGGLALQSCASTLSVVLPASTGHVFVEGDWNGFSNSALPMLPGLVPDAGPSDAGNGINGGNGGTIDGGALQFTASVTLAPGDHAYQLYIDGNAQLDPSQSLETY